MPPPRRASRNPAAARAARRSAEAVRALEARILRARQEEAAVAELLSDPELASVPELAPGVLEQAESRTAAALAASHRAAETLAAAGDRHAQLRDLQRQLGEGMAALEPVAAAAGRAKELADLAGGFGANRLNMTLSAYVLAARLEEVAEVASHRLRAMTQGRYTLIHSDESRGNARSGLRLLVADAWTGQDRDTSTLSGGETFLASLALALGLADVVTASAGGTPLEALFIDEGFGTLDEQTLDEVLDVLDGLREGGRLVGIVSHVPHLRDRIPSRLRVHKGSSGSRVEHSDGEESPSFRPVSVRLVELGESGAPAPAPVAAAPARPPARPTRAPRRPAPSPSGAEQLALLGAD